MEALLAAVPAEEAVARTSSVVIPAEPRQRRSWPWARAFRVLVE
jgi:hypothetical protein